MAGAEPRDFYLFIWMVRVCLREEFLVVFKKGGRPHWNNAKDFHSSYHEFSEIAVLFYIEFMIQCLGQTRDFLRGLYRTL